MKKLRVRRGESVAEVLVSILIIGLVFVFLSEAVTTAARINARIDTEEISFTYPTARPDDSDPETRPLEVTVTLESDASAQKDSYEAGLFSSGEGQSRYYYFWPGDTLAEQDNGLIQNYSFGKEASDSGGD